MAVAKSAAFLPAYVVSSLRLWLASVRAWLGIVGPLIFIDRLRGLVHGSRGGGWGEAVLGVRGAFEHLRVR